MSDQVNVYGPQFSEAYGSYELEIRIKAKSFSEPPDFVWRVPHSILAGMGIAALYDGLESGIDELDTQVRPQYGDEIADLACSKLRASVEAARATGKTPEFI